jgi:hypothetical protein
MLRGSAKKWSFFTLFSLTTLVHHEQNPSYRSIIINDNITMSTPNNKKRSSSNSNKKTEEKKAVGETKPLSEAQAKLQIRSLLGKRTT